MVFLPDIVMSSKTECFLNKQLDRFHSNLYCLIEQFKDSLLQINFEIAPAYYDFTAMNVLKHNNVRNTSVL